MTIIIIFIILLFCFIIFIIINGNHFHSETITSSLSSYVQ